MLIKMYKKILIKQGIFLFSLAILVSSIGCSNYLDIDSTHVAAEEGQWESISDSRSALIGVYGLSRAALANNNGYWIYGELRKGNFSSYKRPDLQAIVNNELNASNDLIEDLSDWRRFYAVINAASVFIEKAPRILEKDSRYSEVNLKYDIAQVRALRAFAYFNLTRIWGDVPLLTAAYDNGSFRELPRTSSIAVLKYAENELIEASKDLPYLYGVAPQNYYGENQSYWNGVLINKVSAFAILAHIAAWKGDYINTEIYSSFVLDNYTKVTADYVTVTDLTATGGFFSHKSPSQLVAFGFLDDYGESTKVGHIEDLALAQPMISKPFPDIYVPKEKIITIFNNENDLRFGLDSITKQYRTNYFTNYDADVPVFSKIKVIGNGTGDGNYSIFGSSLVFSRLEDITLLKAEALTVLNREDDAIILLNLIRTNRGLPVFIKDKATISVLEAIFQERKREFMGEGCYWYDQVRYQRLTQSDPEFVALEKNGGIFWPVSQKVLEANSLITQNNHWK